MNVAEAIAQYGGQAYLLTANADGPHAGLVDVVLTDDGITFDIGKSAAQNIRANANVSLLWPPEERGGYTLIINGKAGVRGDRCELELTKSVLHRPGAPTKPGCAADCIRLVS